MKPVARPRATPTLLTLGLLGCCLLADVSHAQPTGTAAVSMRPVIYPGKGQTPRQQDVDRYECYEWARAQSGFDPARADPRAQAMAPSAAPSAAPPPPGTLVRGALGGAAIAGLADGDAGRGAAIGAFGAAAQERGRQQQAQQRAAQQQAAQTQQRSVYDRAFAACMEARGYTVK
jgi:hypothetical protein